MVRLSLVEENVKKNGIPETQKDLKFIRDRAELNLLKTLDVSKVEDLQYLRFEDAKPQLQKPNKNGSEPRIKNIFANMKKS